MAIRTLYPGDTRHINLHISDPRVSSQNYNLSQAQSLEIVIGTCEQSTLRTISYVASAVTVGAASAGDVQLTLLPSATATLPEGKYQLRIRVVEADGDRYTVYTETVTVPCALPATV
jgi:hypothetical protein